MLDYTKIKLQSDQLDVNSVQNNLKDKHEVNNYQYTNMNNLEITHSDELQYIDLRIKCLSIFEKIKHITRNINPPLFDKLTIEDLMELLDPEFVPKMEQIHF